MMSLSISIAAFIIISCFVDGYVAFVAHLVWFSLKLNEIMTHYFTRLNAMVLVCLWLDPTCADPGIFVRGGPTLRKLFRFCFF